MGCQLHKVSGGFGPLINPEFAQEAYDLLKSKALSTLNLRNA